MFKNALFLTIVLIIFLVFFLSPIAIGVIVTLLSSLNVDFSLGSNLESSISGINLNIWRDFFSEPQVSKSIFLTFKIASIATLLSVLSTFLIGGFFYNSRVYVKLEKKILPFLLSIPHSTFAIGLIFLISPSGFFFRIINLFFNWEAPPQVITYQDPGGYALIASLCIREIPFLLFVVFAALSQIKTRLTSLTASTMGYSAFTIWTKIIWPQIYQRIKLPIFIVLAYSLSPIDLSIIIGPNNPPNLIILILEWFQEPDLYYKKIASSATIFILFILLVQILLWWVIEKITAWLFKRVKTNGRRGKKNKSLEFLIFSFMAIIFFSMFFSFLLNFVWSFAKRWPFPEIFPNSFTLQYWERIIIFATNSYIFNSVFIGVTSTLLGLILCLFFLEAEKKFPFLKKLFTYSIYFPLLIPSILFLFGIYLFYLYFHFDFIFMKIILVHLLFVVPYLFIVLRDNYHHYNEKYSIIAKSLGKNSLVTFFKVKLFLLIKPIIFALIIGFSVSFNEYLSTLWIGEGRVSTVTIEAVNLASGGERNIIGVFAFLQILIPLFFFSFCLYIGRKTEYRL